MTFYFLFLVIETNNMTVKDFNAYFIRFVHNEALYYIILSIKTVIIFNGKSAGINKSFNMWIQLCQFVTFISPWYLKVQHFSVSASVFNFALSLHSVDVHFGRRTHTLLIHNTWYVPLLPLLYRSTTINFIIPQHISFFVVTGMLKHISSNLLIVKKWNFLGERQQIQR